MAPTDTSYQLTIYFEPNDERRARAVIDRFMDEFSYLDDYHLNFARNREYFRSRKHEQTIARIGLEQDPSDGPVILYLFPRLFKCDKDLQTTVLLHEWSHHETFANLTELARFQDRHRIPFLGLRGGSEVVELVKLHNVAVKYIYDLTCIPGEIHAEVWLHEKHPRYSHIRELELYTRSQKNADLVDGLVRGPKSLYHLIPNLVNTLRLRAIQRELQLDIGNDHLRVLDKLWGRLRSHCTKSGLSFPTVAESSDELLEAVRYQHEKEDQIVKIYKCCMEDFGIRSSAFFPSDLSGEVEALYDGYSSS